MQYYRHSESGQVYGASERTVPPLSFFEARPVEFAKAAKPAAKAKGKAKPTATATAADGGDE